MNDISLEAAMAEFLLAAQADGLRPASIKWYTAILRPMVEQFAGQAIGSISVNIMRQYIVALRTRTERYASERSDRPKAQGGLSDESIASHIRALHRFWNWSSVEYGIANPMQNIKRPKPIPPEPKGIKAETFKALYHATGDDIFGKRDRALLAFLIDTNCRANGLITLKLKEIDMDKRKARVLEKGGKHRPVHFNEVTAKLLEDWAAVRPQNANHLFCSLSNRSRGKELTYDGLVQILEALKKKAGITDRTNPHSFRHGFAIEFMMKGGDIGILSRLMGHSSVQVTQWFYAVFTPDQLKQFHIKHSPADDFINDD